MLTDPALLGAGRLRPARARGRRRVPAARALDSAPRGQAAPQRAQPRAAGAGRRDASATAARRRASGSSASWATTSAMPAPSTARCGGRCAPRRRRSAAIWCAPPTACASSTRRAAAERPETWLRALSGGDRRRLRRVRRCAGVHPAERRPLHARGFLPDRRASRRAAALPEAASRVSTRGCPRCTTPGCSVR